MLENFDIYIYACVCCVCVCWITDMIIVSLYHRCIANIDIKSQKYRYHTFVLRRHMHECIYIHTYVCVCVFQIYVSYSLSLSEYVHKHVHALSM